MVGASLATIYGAMFNLMELTYGGAAVYLAALGAMYFPLKRLMARTLVGADFGGIGFKVKKLQVVVAYAPAATTLLLTIPVVVTSLWNLTWWLSPLGALWVVAVVMVMGWAAHRGAVDSDRQHPGKRHVDRHLKEQKSRMRERYRTKE
ncbi:MAG: hypothetical protein GWN18_16295, partial [Thermoplasmata archaeon]|nr:hypothetical protein [Thermoplasmata archaeon]NIS13633.1 hypothetical protein [Thermoplasmata archaeon]NIS21502.1 hypothetical protein [Thermoplasmata archaeon]NIT79066.1 hypothetical protein [Thermoplasmata archaeon]NIU50551.1 hypothetical protein [Thermoplasmata archaeon]